MNAQSPIEQQVLAKAEEDGDFRTRLLEDPKAAIKDATGLSVPDGINIHVLEDNTTDYHLVLPPAGRNLPDQEIGDVAGGAAWVTTW